MYCSSCGVAVPKNLSYCNHCGAMLSGAKPDVVTKPVELFPDSLVWAIVSVFVIGLGSIMGLMAVMKNYGLNDGAVLAFASVIFVMMLRARPQHNGECGPRVVSDKLSGNARAQSTTGC